jgi:hypothetical protein
LTLPTTSEMMGHQSDGPLYDRLSFGKEGQ